MRSAFHESSTETFTVYEDAPKMSQLDLGAPGNSLGDVYHFSARLHEKAGGPVTGEVIGSKTLVKVPTDDNPNLERRATLMFFTFADRKDQIIVFGVADYTPNVPEFEGGPARRARNHRRDWKIYRRARRGGEHA